MVEPHIIRHPRPNMIEPACYVVVLMDAERQREASFTLTDLADPMTPALTRQALRMLKADFRRG